MSLAQLKTTEQATSVYPKLAYKKDKLFHQLISKKENLAVVGLGYVGLPLAVHMASKFKVVGFDTCHAYSKSMTKERVEDDTKSLSRQLYELIEEKPKEKEKSLLNSSTHCEVCSQIQSACFC